MRTMKSYNIICNIHSLCCTFKWCNADSRKIEPCIPFLRAFSLSSRSIALSSSPKPFLPSFMCLCHCRTTCMSARGFPCSRVSMRKLSLIIDHCGAFRVRYINSREWSDAPYTTTSVGLSVYVT